MRIALLKPRWRFPVSQGDPTTNRRWPPLELLNCAAILRSHGHEVRLVDAQAERLSPRAAARRAGGCDLALLTTSPLDRWQCPPLDLGPVEAVALALRDEVPCLAVTGFHGTAFPELVLDRLRADVVLRGEPEASVAALAGGTPWAQIAGLAFRRDGTPVQTPEPSPVELTRLPPPALDLIELGRYDYELLGPRLAVLETARGCSGGCGFCSRLMFGDGVRRKTLEQIGEEIDRAVASGARSIYFIDLEFAADRARAEAVCDMMRNVGSSVAWCCQSRADRVDEPLLRVMRAAGCRLVHFGFESGSQHRLNASGKQLDLQQSFEAVGAARRCGIETVGFFLLGYPGETEAEMQQTIDLARRLEPSYAAFHRLVPYPGSALFAQQDGSVNGTGVPFFAAATTDDARRRQVDRVIARGNRAFYGRPSYLAGRLLRTPPSRWWPQLRLAAGYFF